MAFTYGFAVASKVLGVDYSKKSTTALHPVGALSIDSKGRTWVYVKANGTIGAFKLVKAAAASDPFTNVVIATASNAATKVLGMSPLALAAGDFAWIVSDGVVEDDAVVVSASVANGDPIISDGTGQCVIAVETDINNIIGHCIVDDTDNTGTILLLCS